jgi:hypothetical protein
MMNNIHKVFYSQSRFKHLEEIKSVSLQIKNLHEHCCGELETWMNSQAINALKKLSRNMFNTIYTIIS